MTNTICLVLMAKDEEEVLPRLIDNIRGFVDYVYYCDTGSTDKSISIIQEECKEGFRAFAIDETPWVSFQHNRQYAITEAGKTFPRADWLLVLDADIMLDWEIEHKDNLDKTVDSYLLKIKNNNLEFYRSMMWRNRPGLTILGGGGVHEYLYGVRDDNKPVVVDKWIGPVWRDVGVAGGVRNGRYEGQAWEHLKLIEADDDTTRQWFYLAQTYRDLGYRQMARLCYQHRASLGGWEEEVYYSLYQVALITNTREDWLRAIAARPWRAEAVYEYMKYCNAEGNHSEALGAYYVWRENVEAREHLEEDILFVHWRPRDYGCKLEASLAHYYLGEYSDYRALSNTLLFLDSTPDDIKALVKNNLDKYPGVE